MVKEGIQVFVAALASFILAAPPSAAFGDDGHTLNGEYLHLQQDRAESEEYADPFDDIGYPVSTLHDPFEPVNRIFFTFNDRLYFLLLKPMATGYGYVVPEKARISVRRFFSNLTTPVRFINALLQFKGRKAGSELRRFIINTTIGLGGFLDPATERYRIFKQTEDTGQTLGFYGAGPGVYLHWPFFGPSSLRDSIGLGGDIILDPKTYFFPHDRALRIGLRVYDKGINETSLNIGVYEGIKRDALDPYMFVRDAYHQHRENMIRE